MLKSKITFLLCFSLDIEIDLYGKRLVLEMHVCMLSHFSYVRLFDTLWAVVHQAPLFMGFSRKEYWSGLPCPPPLNPHLLLSSALAGKLFTASATWEALAAKSLQLCPTLCDPIDGIPPGSPVPGILQARTLEWDAISFSNA